MKKVIMKPVKYVNTVGLNVNIDGKPKSVRVSFALMDDDKTVIATVESGYNLEPIKSLGKRTITRDELRNMPEDPYDNIVFARAAFALFDLEF